jgi:hypothetical protein
MCISIFERILTAGVGQGLSKAENSFGQTGTLQLSFQGAQPPRLQFGAPSRRTFAGRMHSWCARLPANADGEGVGGGARGGRAPQESPLPGAHVEHLTTGAVNSID